MNKKELYKAVMSDLSKIVKKQINEAKTYYDPQKDEQRIQSIIDKSKGDSFKMMGYAFRMALSIKDPVKLDARLQTATELLGTDHIITQCFKAIKNQRPIVYPSIVEYMSDSVKKIYTIAFHEYVVKCHNKDKEYFEVIDSMYTRYSPTTVISDNIDPKYGDFMNETKVGKFIHDLYMTYENYIYYEGIQDELLNLFQNYVSGFDRATIDELIEYGYKKDDFEDITNFYEMPVELQEKFEEQ